MYVISPNRHGNARRICKALGFKGVRHEGVWGRDFFLWYPQGRGPIISPDYGRLAGFFRLNKADQRTSLGLPHPPTATLASKSATLHELAPGLGFVVRPLRHAAGRAYRLTDTATDFRQGYEYVSAIFPKAREFRLIFCQGQFVVACEKLPAEGMGQRDAWNLAQGARFLQRKAPRCGSEAIKLLAGTWPINTCSLVGVDIMVDKSGAWSFLELNTAPALGPFNLKRVAQIAGGWNAQRA